MEWFSSLKWIAPNVSFGVRVCVCVHSHECGRVAAQVNVCVHMEARSQHPMPSFWAFLTR